MADVLIVHAKEKQTVAHRLRDAIAGGGYGVEAIGAESPYLKEQVASAAVVVLVWSKVTMASDAAGAAGAEARRAGKLVEVSPDGLMPVSATEEGRAVLISGWRGEPFHPGWQKVAAAIERICGRRKSPVPVARQPAATAARSAAPAAGAAAPARAPIRAPVRFGAVAGVAAALFAAVGAAAWMSGSSAPEAAVETAQAAPAAAEALPPPEPAPADFAEPASVAEPPAPTQVSAAEPAPRPPARIAPRPRPAVSRSAALRPGETRTSVAVPERPLRYRHARTMRLFCERAGRGTPQCRTFMRNRQRDD
jgi:hypothetical protein